MQEQETEREREFRVLQGDFGIYFGYVPNSIDATKEEILAFRRIICYLTGHEITRGTAISFSELSKEVGYVPSTTISSKSALSPIRCGVVKEEKRYSVNHDGNVGGVESYYWIEDEGLAQIFIGSMMRLSI